MRRRAAITLLAALAIGAGVAACGSSSSSSSTAAAAGGATVTAPTDAQVKARLNLATCLRAKGINVPDPVASGLRVGIVKALSNIDTASPAFQKANTACASLRPGRLAPG